jgi:hypothetical protein
MRDEFRLFIPRDISNQQPQLPDTTRASCYASFLVCVVLLNMNVMMQYAVVVVVVVVLLEFFIFFFFLRGECKRVSRGS